MDQQTRLHPIPIAIIAGQLVVGGAEKQLYLWLAHLDRRLFNPVVVTLHPGFGDYWEEVIETLDIPVLRIPHCSNRLIRLLDIVRALRPYKPDLIHGWHLFASPYAGAAAKILGARSLGGVRGTFEAFRNNSFVSNLALLLDDGILANSKTVAGQLRGVRKRKNQIIYMVQNAVEKQEPNNRLKLRQMLSKQFGIPSSGILIGSLGRLDPGKRFDLLLKVMLLLQEDGKKIYCILIGDGPERSGLEKMAISLGVTDTVVFAGEIPNASNWLEALDIFCFMSLDEGLPNAVMEASMAGVPVVSWRASFMEELLGECNADMLIEPENLMAFKEALLTLIHSPELRVKMGEEGRLQMLENFSLEQYVRRMNNVYDDILGIPQRIDQISR